MYGRPIALVLGVAAFSFLAYALMDLPYDGAAADNRRGDPLSSPSRPTPPLSSDIAHVPAGTRLNIRLEEAIREGKDVSGDRFTAVLYGPLIVGTKFLAPSRSKIIGQLTPARGLSGVEEHDQLAMVLEKLLVNGKEYPLATEQVPLSGAGRGFAIHGDPAVHEPESQLTFTLSSPLELPVIRTMGSIGREVESND